MEKKKYTMLILILLLVLVLFGMLMTQFLGGNYAVMGRKLSSWNGKYTIGVPRNWEACDAPTSSALISAKTSRDDMYLLVSLDSYDYGEDMTLDLYVSNYLSYVAGNSDEVSETKMLTLPEMMNVGGISGYYYEYIAPSKGMQVHMFCFAADTSDGYLAVQVACNESAAEENRNTAKAIISALRVHQEEPPAPAAEAEPADDGAADSDTGGEGETEETSGEEQIEEEPVAGDSP